MTETFRISVNCMGEADTWREKGICSLVYHGRKTEMKQKPRRRKDGFTLMEVLLVLAILVILGSMVTYYFVGAQKKGYAKAALTQIGMFERMLTDYRLDVGSYPTTDQGLQALRVPPGDLANSNKWAGPYAAKEIPADPWGNPYQYERPTADTYRIWSWGADGQNGSEDDVVNTQ